MHHSRKHGVKADDETSDRCANLSYRYVQSEEEDRTFEDSRYD